MSQDNPFGDLIPGSAPSAAPQQRRGFIPGVPKAPPQPTPLQINADRRAEAAATRDQIRFDRDQATGGDKPVMVPEAAAKRTESNVGNYTSLRTATDTFKDDFGGNPLGSLENTAQSFVDVGTPGQREWWSAFKATDNQIRNDLFGSALTATEKASYEQTTVSPGMRPEIIRQNVTRRAQIIKDALARQRQFMLANGYKPEAVDALFAPILEQQQALAENADQASEKQAPAFGGAAPPPAGQPPAPTGQIPGVGMDNGGGGSQQLAQGGFEQVDDPVLSGVRAEYRNRLQRGDSAGQLIAWARSAGITDPGAMRSIAEQAAYRRKNPDVPIEQYDTSELDDKYVPLSAADQMINSAAQSSVGAGLIAAGDAASGFTLDNIIGATGGNAERARLGMDAVADANPVPNLVGTVGGGMLSALALEGGAGAAGLSGIARTLGADATYGAGAGFGGTDTGSDGSPASFGERAVGAGKGTLAALVGSGAGNMVAKGARGVADASAQVVRDAGIPMTLGQIAGRSGKAGAMIKSAEDRLAGIPIVGDMINARRTEGVQAFNSKAFDRALEPIKKAVGDKVGEEAVDVAQQQVSEAFETALSGKVVQADKALANELTQASMQTMSLPRVGKEVGDSIREILAPYMTGPQMTGDAMQQISRELRDLKAGYASDPLKHRIGKAIDATEGAIFGMFKRQAPEVLPAYNAAKKAQRRVFILADAVNKAKNAEGVFTPAQLGQADRSNAIAYGSKLNAARGKGEFHDFQRAAQNVLPSKIPDSGTAGRIIIPALALGGGGAADQYGGTGGAGLTLGAILAGAYTKAGQRVLTKPMRGATSKAGKAVGSETGRKAISAGAAASGAALTTQ